MLLLLSSGRRLLRQPKDQSSIRRSNRIQQQQHRVLPSRSIFQPKVKSLQQLFSNQIFTLNRFFSFSPLLQQDEHLHHKPTQKRNSSVPPSSNSNFQSPIDRYKEMVAAKEIVHDPKQYQSVELLDQLFQQLKTYQPQQNIIASSSSREDPESSKTKAGGIFSSLLGAFGRSTKSPATSSNTISSSNRVRGLYLWGGVGTGKTMLMDMFYNCFSMTEKKKRVHFHTFMLDVHARVHKFRHHLHYQGDPLPQIAQAIAEEAWLLCFDEFQVNDVADALILRRLFGLLFDEHGCIVVTTSNRPPEDLYEGGLNRGLFLPFIDLLKERCKVHNLDSNDYRTRTKTIPHIYNFPASSPATVSHLDSLFFKLSDNHSSSAAGCAKIKKNVVIPVMMGRTIVVPRSLDGVCQFSFKDLCEQPLGVADYLAICSHYHTLILSNIPKFNEFMHNEAKRFITLLDIAYERNTGLICSADVPLEQLFDIETLSEDEPDIGDLSGNPSSKNKSTDQKETKPSTNKDELGYGRGNTEYSMSMSALHTGKKDTRFATKRAISRLTEMQSREYWSHHPKASVLL